MNFLLDVGTPGYIAPEYETKYAHRKHSYEGDVFSFSMLLWRLIFRKPLWDKDRQKIIASGKISRKFLKIY